MGVMSEVWQIPDQSPAPSVTSCVTLDKSIPYSDPQSLL